MFLAEIPSARELADAVGVSLDGAHADGRRDLWRGPFGVDDIAVASVGVATVAASQLLAVRNSVPRVDVRVDSRHAAAAFLSETLLDPIGWTLPPVWDPVAGDYRASDGWIRLHTNYPHHRSAALEVLGLGHLAWEDVNRDLVAGLVAGWKAEALEASVVANNGVAARQRNGDGVGPTPGGRGRGR